MNGRARIAGLIAGAAVLASLAACAAGATQPEAKADKAGANPGPLVLRLGTEDDAGRPGAEQIRQFAKQVDELSGGSISITPVWDANGDDEQGGWDQVVAGMVMSGSLDMGMIPARAWDTEGVLSLRALEAPFLVTSDALAARIVTSDLADDLLAGLDTVGVKGLALAPESLRHLFMIGDPPRSVADLAGAVIRSPRSKTDWALFEALGAKGDDFTEPGASADDALAAGKIRGFESSFALAGTIPGGMTALGNLPLYPKINSLVVNETVYERLTDQQRTILDEAAAKMVTYAIDAMPDTLGYAAAYCRNGGRIVLADDAFLAELHQAVRPVFDALSTDPATASLIERIRALAKVMGAEAAPPAVEPCSTTEPVPSLPTGQGAGAFPDGVYRAEVSLEELVAAGVDRPTAYNHAGTWTLIFRDGQLMDPDCPGSTYAVQGDRITITLGPSGSSCGDAAGKVLFSGTWSLEGDQMTFGDVVSGHGSDLLIKTLFGRTFTKIE